MQIVVSRVRTISKALMSLARLALRPTDCFYLQMWRFWWSEIA